MTEFEQTMLLAIFATKEHQSIANKILDKYNTSHREGVRAALNDAAWRGFCAGLEAAKRLNKD